MLIINTVLRVAELAGAGLAFAVWLSVLFLPVRLRAAIVGIVLCAYVVALRLEPFQFQAGAREFGWVPFLGLMRGSLQVDALGRRWAAALLVTALLFATSWAETYLPGRSAEITDALLALIIAVVFALLPPERDAQAEAGPARLSARERRLRDWQREQARSLGVKIDR